MSSGCVETGGGGGGGGESAAAVAPCDDADDAAAALAPTPRSCDARLTGLSKPRWNRLVGLV